MPFWEFLAAHQWTYWVIVAGVSAVAYAWALGRAIGGGADLRQDVYSAVAVVFGLELLFAVTLGIATAAGAVEGFAWLGPIHTYVVLPVTFLVLGVAAASSARLGFRRAAGLIFAIHLGYAIGMLVWFQSRGELRFMRPEALWLLAIVGPLVAWWWWRSMSLATGVRAGVTLVMRLLLLGLIVIAAAEPNYVEESESLEVIFVIDRSASMPQNLLPRWYEAYIERKLSESYQDRLEAGPDKFSWGIIGFAGDAVQLQRMQRAERVRVAEPDEWIVDVTDLAAAVRQALAMFTTGARKRLVVVTDGNANRGDVLDELDLALNAGVVIDVVPVPMQRAQDVRIEQMNVAGEARIGQRIEPRLVVYSTSATTATLRVTVRRDGVPLGLPPGVQAELAPLLSQRAALEDQRTGGAEGLPPMAYSSEERERRQQLDERIAAINGQIRALEAANPARSGEIVLAPGKNVVPIPLLAYDQAGFYELQVELTAPDHANAIVQNDTAVTYTVVRGRNRILYIAGDRPEGNARFVAQLRRALADRGGAEGPAPNIVSVGVDQIPSSVAEWRMYDCVITSNLAASQWSPTQQRTLSVAIEQFGTGYVMLGGDASFGAGGYSDQPIVEALPVRMEIENQEVLPRGALVLVLHTCEFPAANYHTKQMAQAALDTLTDRDEFGILTFSWGGGGGRGVNWLFDLQPIGGARAEMTTRIASANPGDMPDFVPAMRAAYAALAASTAGLRHCVVISDGDANVGDSYDQAAAAFKLAQTTTAGIVIVPHDASTKEVMAQLAAAGGPRETWADRFYDVSGNQLGTLPQIFTREASRVRNAMIREGEFDLSPVRSSRDDYLAAVLSSTGTPPLLGLVGVTPKPRSRTTLAAVERTSGEGGPLLIDWSFGLGRVACWTSDVTNPGWAADFQTWPRFRQFWGDVVTWAARPGRTSSEQPAEVITSLTSGGQGEVVLDARDEAGRPLELPSLEATVIDPANRAHPLRLDLIEPGRYRASFDAAQQGAYQIAATYRGHDGRPRFVTGGLSVPYSREFRDLSTNWSLLTRLADRGNGKFVDVDLVPAGTRGGVDPDSPDLILGSDLVADPTTREPIRAPPGAGGLGGGGGPVAYDPFATDLPLTLAYTPIWQGFVIAALVLLFLDIFFRKVFVSWEQFTGTFAPLLARLPVTRYAFVEPERIQVRALGRLHAAKASAGERLARDVAAAAPAPGAPREAASLPLPDVVLAKRDALHREGVADFSFKRSLHRKSAEQAQRGARIEDNPLAGLGPKIATPDAAVERSDEERDPTERRNDTRGGAASQTSTPSSDVGDSVFDRLRRAKRDAKRKEQEER